MAHFFDDYSDDERGFSRGNSLSDKKFPRHKTTMLSRLFEADDEELMGLIRGMSDDDSILFFYKDLDDLEPEKEIKEEIQMKDDFISTLIIRIDKILALVKNSDKGISLENEDENMLRKGIKKILKRFDYRKTNISLLNNIWETIKTST